MSDIIRPNMDHIFPVIPSPWHGEVALGNGTQWRMQLLRSSDYGIALHVVRWGLAVFNGQVSAAKVRKYMPKIIEGDATNLADFLNDQLHGPSLRVARVGYYFPNLLQEWQQEAAQ